MTSFSLHSAKISVFFPSSVVKSRDYTHTHLTKHYSRVIGLLVIAMLCLLFAVNVQSLACEHISCMVDAAGTLSPLAGLSIGIALLLIAMAVEWNAILNNVRVEEMSLNVVESKHPRLPKKFEIIIASILSLALLILFVQFVLTVYAMSFSLSSSTSESKDTRQVLLGDFDGDGDLDYLSGNSDGGNVYRLDLYTNNGTGAFSNATFGSSESFQEATAGDIDGDGDLDLIYAYTAGGALARVKNSGAATFVQDNFSSATLYEDVLLNDFNNDGSLDVLAAGSNYALFLNTGHGLFVQTGSVLPTLSDVTTADFNSDGYLDVATSDGSQNFRVYLNSGTGSFTRSYNTTLGTNGPVIAGDFDGDGNIDVVAGSATNQILVEINNGNGTSFGFPSGGAAVASNLNTLRSLAAADVDNDGDLDVIASGGPTAGGARLFLNGGTGILTENGVATETSDSTYGIAIGDIDGDGDVDYVRGNDSGGAGAVNRHYKSDQAATSPNTAPSAPLQSTLIASKISDNGSGAVLRLSWGSGSDAETSTKLLQYQLQMGTGSNSNSFISGKTAGPHWVTRLVPNGQSRTQLLRNVPCGQTYYWSVATVDTGFKSTRSSEQSLTLDAICSFSVTASAVVTGGGTLWKIPKPVLEPVIAYGRLHLSAYEDVNGNGTKDVGEKNGFAGLSITASGSTASGVAVSKTLALSEQGEVLFELEPSDSSGYALLVDTGSLALKDYVLLGGTASGRHIVRADMNEYLSFRFRRSALLSYKPCLDIVDATHTSKGTSDAALLLHRLQGPYSSFITDGLSLSGSLVTRRDFLTLLQRTQCIPLLTNPMELMQQAAAVRFIDMPPMLMAADSLVLYSLLHAGLPVARETPSGKAADLASPISRREVITLLGSAMKLDPMALGSGETLPIDLAFDDPLVPDFLALKKAGILPKSFLHVLGPAQGIDPVEMPILLTRSAFQTGHISLLPASFESAEGTHAAAAETFSSLLPPFPERSCLEIDPNRAEKIVFQDLLPADPLEPGVRALLRYGVKNDDGKMLWLVPATKKPTEFGVSKGSIALSPDQPVPMLEVLRSLLVLRCLPPPAARESVPALLQSLDASEGTRVSNDALSGLPRNTTFASRTLYRAQDHERAFDLSLFTFAPRLLTRDPVPVESMLSIEDGADLLASALLNIYVHEELLSRQEAENLAQDLSVTLQKEFLGDTPLSQARLLPLQRRMLLQFLSTLLVPEGQATETLGEVWWKRVGE